MPLDQDIARTAAEQANKLFGKWMPERWIDLFIDCYDDIKAARGDDSEVLQNDLQEMLQALGMFDGARPQSPHTVFQECLAEVRRLKGIEA
jgi:hypothetical protein